MKHLFKLFLLALSLFTAQTVIAQEDNIDTIVEKQLRAWYQGYTKYDANPNYFAKNSQLVLTDSVYAEMLGKLPSAFHFSYNATVKESLDEYIYKRRKTIEYALLLGNIYFPEMENVLDEFDLPYELKYLTIIESALKLTARSYRGARGLWQLMPRTGKHYGLTINSLVDERLDIKLSTAAACRLLKDMYQLYDNWLLAIAAYNCGPGNVNKALRKSKDSSNVWEVYTYLPRETKKYITSFVAVYFAMYYYRELGITPRVAFEDLKPISYVSIDKKISLKEIAQKSNISLDELKTLNPQFRRNIVPGHIKTYEIRLPFSSVISFEQNKDSLVELEKIDYKSVPKYAKASSHHKGSRYYRVRRGDTLGGIAKRYHVKLRQLKRWNNLRSNFIRVGQRLVIH